MDLCNSGVSLLRVALLRLSPSRASPLKSSCLNGSIFIVKNPPTTEQGRLCSNLLGFSNEKLPIQAHPPTAPTQPTNMGKPKNLQKTAKAQGGVQKPKKPKQNQKKTKKTVAKPKNQRKGKTKPQLEDLQIEVWFFLFFGFLVLPLFFWFFFGFVLVFLVFAPPLGTLPKL